MNEQQKKSIQDNVLAAINAGQVHMRPRWHFVAKAVLLVTGIVLAVLVLVYIVSLIIFILHQTGVWFTPGFGLRGVREFLVGLPWFLVGLIIVFIVILQILVKHFSFSYGRPLLYSAVAIVLLVGAGGFAIALTPIHQNLFNHARDNELPFAGGLYRQYGLPREPRGGVVPGEIIEIIEHGYNINTPRSELLQVLVTPQTHLSKDSNLEIGDRIVVVGDRQGTIITAFGIQEVDRDAMQFAPPRPPRH